MVNYISDHWVWIKNVGGDLDALDASFYFQQLLWIHIYESYQHLLVEFPRRSYAQTFIHSGEQHVKPPHMVDAQVL
jgi:hypothetical protein